MPYEINGKASTREEVEEMLNNDKVKLTKFSMDLLKNKEPADLPTKLSHEGFYLDEGLIGGLSKQMTKTRAGYGRLAFKGSPYIYKRDLYIIMLDQDYLPKWKKWLIGLIEKLL